MAVTARLKSSQLTAIYIGTDLISDVLRGCEMTNSPNVIDATCVKDDYTYEIPGIRKYDLVITAAIESTGAFSALLGTEVNFTHDIHGHSVGGRGYVFDYRGGITVDGLQEEAMRISVNTV
jgi:hypothetical protein